MAEQNETNAGLVILSVLIPIIGYILYFKKKDDFPSVAKNYLWSALAGSIIGFLILM